MRKTVISAATLAMSTALVGIALAAGPDGSTPTDDSSVISPVSTSVARVGHAPDDSAGRVGGGHGIDDTAVPPSSMPVPSTRTHERSGADDVADAPDDSDGRVAGGQGVDDPAGHDAMDDHGVDPAGHDAADDHGVDPAGHDAGDDHGVDPAGHDAGDDHGAGRHGADDGPGHDAGDDSGSGGHGSDD
jgi:hypothetical protein